MLTPQQLQAEEDLLEELHELSREVIDAQRRREPDSAWRSRRARIGVLRERVRRLRLEHRLATRR